MKKEMDVILKIKQILELKSTKALIFKIIEHIWDGRFKKKTKQNKTWDYLVWEIEKMKKKKKTQCWRTPSNIPTFANTVLEEKIETTWNKLFK